MSEFITEIVFNPHSENEIVHEGVFASMDDAVKHIESQIQGHRVRVWINNEEVHIESGKVIMKSDEPLTYGEHFLSTLNKQNAGDL